MSVMFDLVVSKAWDILMLVYCVFNLIIAYMCQPVTYDWNSISAQ